MFQRLHPESKYRGSRVGLAIYKKIIQQHDGEIVVSSSRGQGPTFFFTHPKLPDNFISRQTGSSVDKPAIEELMKRQTITIAEHGLEISPDQG
ncbi:MAG: hypothetical protein LW870_05395 [Pirellula sp.]|jgi:hypothetical protein|nr:hypothetical protein [Pirellula sp.]